MLVLWGTFGLLSKTFLVTLQPSLLGSTSTEGMAFVHGTRAGSGLQNTGLGLYIAGLGFCRPGCLCSKIGLGILLNTQKVRPTGFA
jgi:hypothetical protein